MNYVELDISVQEDETCLSHQERPSLTGEKTDRVNIIPTDSHERYHAIHQESTEKLSATEEDGDWDPVSDAGRAQSLDTLRLTRMVHHMEQKILSLQEQIKSSTGNVDGTEITSHVLTNVGTNQPSTRPQLGLRQQKFVPQINEVDWSGFMTKYEEDEHEFAIEVLVGEPEYRRKSAKKKSQLDIVQIQEVEAVTQNIKPAASGILSTDAPPLPERIRINSPLILSTLAHFDKTLNASEPNMMKRPFKLLIHCEEKIRDYMQLLQDGSVQSDAASPMDYSAEAYQLERFPTVPKNSDDRNSLLEHLQCLIAFIDTYIRPVIERLKSGPDTKVRFTDIWYLFQPGDDIFMPVKDRQRNVSMDPMNINPEMFQSRYERLWRVIGTGGGRKDISVSQDRNAPIRRHPFKINCYYIDFDGLYFCPIIHPFSIQPFAGERLVTSLDFFPLRYLKEGTKLREKSLAQGKLVFNALLQSHTHFYYRGPSLVTHPCGCQLQGGNSVHQEHVESEVIVDYRAALLKHPSWRPQPSFWKPPPYDPSELQEKFRIRYLDNRNKPKLLRNDPEHVYNDNIVDKERALRFKNRERMFDPVPSGWLSNEKSVPEADVAMLSPRVFAFVLRTRTFVPLWLWGLQKISAQGEGLRNLQLRDNTFKNTIHALVRTHFLQRAGNQSSDCEYDLVRGKGKGLVFLLHGAPGVGKTFTAESVAAANGRPLFQITCGDLGLTPSEVEKALKEIFRYAQLWNCVLLLDECDIFLTQRTKTDLKRNSLVSVFLRVLEWYTGVLFLTTNRVGSLDSAVKSRITWSTYYPPLDLAQTREIWKINLNLLEKRKNIEVDRKGILKFAKDHFNKSIQQGSNWNGRQIQNAFKVALSLADWDTFTSEEQRPLDTSLEPDHYDRKLRVTPEHFETVAIAAETFDDYLQEATGITEAERAFQAQERADDYQLEVAVQEDDNYLAPPEPSVKKRRTSSNAGPPQVSVGPMRRSSLQQPQISTRQQQVPPTQRDRRSSIQANSSNGQPTWSNGNAQNRKNSASYVGQLPASAGNPSSTNKRKRPENIMHSPGSLQTIQADGYTSDSDSDSELQLDSIVGVGSDEIDDWE